MYTVEDFERVVDTLRNGVEGSCTVATDVICGFPGETEGDWHDTMTLLKKYQFSVLHISQFYPRPGTPAARMTRLKTEIVKERSREASAYFNSYYPYTSLLGKTLRVLVTEVSADGKHYVGHDKRYRQVLVPMDENLMGKVLDVKIVRTGKFFVEGEVLQVLEKVGGVGGKPLDVENMDNASTLAGHSAASLPAALSPAFGGRKAIPKLVNVNGKMVRVGGADDDGSDGSILSLSTQGKLDIVAAAIEADDRAKKEAEISYMLAKWAKKNKWGVAGVSLVAMLAGFYYGPSRTSWRVALGLSAAGIASFLAQA
jgi:threonylcarbamoyladenosine tRNA methylthiotransferase CDKAL1